MFARGKGTRSTLKHLRVRHLWERPGKCFGIPQAELEDMAEQKDVWATMLSLLLSDPRISIIK